MWSKNFIIRQVGKLLGLRIDAVWNMQTCTFMTYSPSLCDTLLEDGTSLLHTSSGIRLCVLKTCHFCETQNTTETWNRTTLAILTAGRLQAYKVNTSAENYVRITGGGKRKCIVENKLAHIAYKHFLKFLVYKNKPVLIWDSVIFN